MRSINVNRETLRYERVGRGQPLLLIHSLGTGCWLWREQMAHWCRSMDVIAFDLRGHGGSTHNGPVTVETIADDLRVALDAMKLGAVQVVAISMGGPIVSHLYSADPEAISRIVIADSFARQGSAGASRIMALEESLRTMSMADYAKSYAEGTLHPSTDKRQFEKLTTSVVSMEKEVYLQIARSVFTSDVATLMSGIKCPVRVVVGEQDTRTPPALSEEIARLIGHSDLVRVEHAAHLANLDNPDGFHSAIDSFLALSQPS